MFGKILEWVTYFFPKKDVRLLVLGLDNSGKTTLIHMLKTGKLSSLAPTLHPTAEEVAVGSVRFRAHDMGGHAQARKLWMEYAPGSAAVVFLVDTADPDRIDEAKAELDGLLALDALKDVPFLILANKMDLSASMKESVIRERLGIHQLAGQPAIWSGDTKNREIELFPCSIVKRTGYLDGLTWLANCLK